MGIFRKIYITLLFVVISMLAHQKLCYSQSVSRVDPTVSFVITYGGEPDGSAADYFISELTRENLKGLNNTKFLFTFSFQNNEKRISDSLFSTDFSIRNLEISGDNTYRDLSVEKVLCPDTIVTTWALTSGDSFETLSVQLPLYFSKEDNIYKFEYQHDFSISKVELLGIVPRYRSEKKLEFDAFLSYIDSYYSARRMLGFADQQIKALELLNCNNITKTFGVLLMCDDILKTIDQHEFPSRLSLLQHDPVHLLTEYSAVNRLYQHKLASTKRYITNCLDLPVTKVIIESSKNYVASNVALLKASRSLAPSYAPFYYQVSSCNYNELLKMEAFELIEFLIHNRNGMAINVATIFGDELRASYFSEALKFIEEEKYSEAIVLLENVISVLNQLNEPIDLEVENAMSKAKYGVYYAYIQTAEKAISVGQYSLCGRFLGLAEDYQQENSSYIINTIATDGVKEKLINHNLILAERFNDEKRYKQAEDFLMQIDELSQGIAYISNSEGIDVERARCYRGLYLQALENSNTYYKLENSDSALICLNRARACRISNENYIKKSSDELELVALLVIDFQNLSFQEDLPEGWQFTDNRSFIDSLRVISESWRADTSRKISHEKSQHVIGYISTIIEQSFRSVYLGKSSEARRNLLEARYVLKYLNINDKATIKQVDSLQMALVQAQCLEEKRNLDGVFKSIYQEIENNNYTALGRSLEQASTIVNYLPLCFDKESLTLDSLSAIYALPIAYSALLQVVENAYKNGEYYLSAEMLIVLTSSYDFETLIAFELNKPNLYSFVKNKHNSRFTLEVMKLATQNNFLVESCQMMELLPKSEDWMKRSASAQQDLGKRVAEQMLNSSEQEEASDDFLVAILNESAKERYYKNFWNSYKVALRNLNSDN